MIEFEFPVDESNPAHARLDELVRAYDEGVAAGNAGAWSASNPYYGDGKKQMAWLAGWRASGGLRR